VERLLTIRWNGCSASVECATIGTLTVGSALWGKVASLAGVPTALYISAGCAALGMIVSWPWKLQTSAAQDLTPSLHWDKPAFAEQIDVGKGPILITVEYHIDRKDREPFLALSSTMRPIQFARLPLLSRVWTLLQRNIEPTNRGGQFESNLTALQIQDDAPAVRESDRRCASRDREARARSRVGTLDIAGSGESGRRPEQFHTRDADRRPQAHAAYTQRILPTVKIENATAATRSQDEAGAEDLQHHSSVVGFGASRQTPAEESGSHEQGSTASKDCQRRLPISSKIDCWTLLAATPGAVLAYPQWDR
jgi:hypothetical protein